MNHLMPLTTSLRVSTVIPAYNAARHLPGVIDRVACRNGMFDDCISLQS